MLIIYSIPALAICTILLLAWLMPLLTPATVPFGVRIPPTHIHEPVMGMITRDYRIGLVLAALLTGGSYWLLVQPASFVWLILAETLAASLLFLLNYIIAHRRVLQAKQQGKWYEGLRQVLVADTEQAPPAPALPWPWIGINLTLIIVNLALALVRYPLLPDQIPIHFGLDGQPDQWGDKMPMAFFSPILAIFLTLLIIGIANATRTMRQRLDPTSPETSRQIETHYQRIWSRAMLQIGATINLILLGSSLPTLLIVPDLSGMVGLIILAPLALIIIIITLAIVQTARIVQQINGSVREQNSYVPVDDDPFWFGGMIYSNRNDPSIFVPKRFGVGTTVNFGHPMGILALTALIGIPLLITIILLLVTRTT